MKRILWLSRHAPTEEQINALSEIFGEVDIIQVSKTVKNAGDVFLLIKEVKADELVAVLPINLIADLTRHGIKPLRAVMSRHIDKETGEVSFTFDHFERVERVDIVTTPL